MCPKCSKNIRLLGTNSIVGKCDSCGFTLGDCDIEVVSPDEFESIIYENWIYLFEPGKKFIGYGNLMSDFAIRVLYLVNKGKLSELLKNSLEDSLVIHLYQTISSKNEMQGFEYLEYIMRISSIVGIRIKDIFNIMVPEYFIKSYKS